MAIAFKFGFLGDDYSEANETQVLCRWMLAQFLARFADCFHGIKGQRLFAAHVSGLLSELQRKIVQVIALKQGIAPRTLQRFLDFIHWDHE